MDESNTRTVLTMDKVLISLILFGFLTSASASLNIGTYNIRNFNPSDKFKGTDTSELKKVISRLDADLIGVQEIKNKSAFDAFIRSQFKDYRTQISECGGSGRQKLGFVYNAKKLKLIKFWEDLRLSASSPDRSPNCNSGTRPAFMAQFINKDTGEKFTAIVLHLKAGGKERDITKRYYQIGVLSKMIQEIKASGHRNLVMMGDFNTTEFHKKSDLFVKFNTFIKNTDFENKSHNIQCSSYWSGGKDDGIEYPSQLAHVMNSKSWSRRFKSTTKLYAHCKAVKCKESPSDEMGVTYEKVSDHCPVMVEFSAKK